jgi:hypothetical protein
MDDPQVEPTETPNTFNPPSLRDQAFAIVRAAGLSQIDTGKAFGLTSGRACQIDAKLRASRYDITSPKYVKQAVKSLHSLLKGEPVGTVDKVKDSTVLGAVGMVLDRHQPIKRTDSSPQSITFIQVNVGEYK